MLHVPVKEFTADTATVKQRIQEGRKICAIQFTKRDVFAVGQYDGMGKGNRCEILGRRKRIYAPTQSDQEKIEKARKSLGGEKQPGENRKYWMHLKHLSEHYAHEISSQIIGFCLEKQVSLIVLPKYKKNTQTM